MEEWGVYEHFCSRCGMRILIVATIHSVENGYAEALGDPVCMTCKGMAKVSAN